MKPLPKENWHYLWETYDGNNYEVRKMRAEQLLELCFGLGIKVMESNIREGKEARLSNENFVGNKLDSTENLKLRINNLQVLPKEKENNDYKNKEIKRPLVKWIILSFVSLYTFFYIVYFWLYEKTAKKPLLGAKEKINTELIIHESY